MSVSLMLQMLNNEFCCIRIGLKKTLYNFAGLSIEMATHKRRAEFKDVPNVASELRSVTSPDTEHLRTNIEYQGLQIKFSFRLSEEFWTLGEKISHVEVKNLS